MTPQSDLLKFGKSLAEVEADFKKAQAKKQRTRSMLIVTVALLSAAGADFWVVREHAAFFWDALPGFNAIYGLVSAIFLVHFSAALGHRFLMRQEPAHPEQ